MSDTDEETGIKYIQEHYELLKECSHKKDMTEWNEFVRTLPEGGVLLEGAEFDYAHLKGAELNYAHLEGAKLNKAHLEGAKLNYAHLEGAELIMAHLEGANLIYAHLEGAELIMAHLEHVMLHEANLKHAKLHKTHLEGARLDGAHLEGAELNRSHLEGAKLNRAHLEDAKLNHAHLEHANLSVSTCNGSTRIYGCYLDKDTRFVGVSLENIQWSPGLKQLAEYNNRRHNWLAWYNDQPVLKWPFKAFWYFSDYGHSGTQVMKWFCYLSGIFAWAYFCWPEMIQGFYTEGMPAWLVVLRSIYFSVVTMTTLGFGDIHANSSEPWGWWSYLGHILLISQAILGYVILGALVTRLSILFNSDGPSADFAKPYSPKSWTDRLKSWCGFN